MKIGFLGAGKVALHHAAVFKHLGADIVVGSARSERSERWQKFHERTGARFSTPREILVSPDVDGLIICLPPEETAKLLDDILNSAKPALIEKPVRPNASAAVKPNKLVGYNRRYYTIVGRIRERLLSGGLIAVHATFPGDLFGSAIHGFDLLFHLFGPLKWKHAGRNGLALTPGGTPVLIGANRDEAVNAGIKAVFEDGASWILTPFETLSIYRGFDVSGTTVRRYAPRLIERIEEPADFKPGFLQQARAFLSGDFGPGARPNESIELMRFVDEIS